MKITVLDGYCLNPGDLFWEPIAALGDFSVYDRTAPEEILGRAKESEVLLVNKTPLTAGTIAALPKLRYVGVLATGYNVVDVAACDARGIVVTNVPSYGTAAVAEMIFALMLTHCRRVELHDGAVKAGQWCACPDYSFQLAPQTLLAGRTFGVIGYGRIGEAAAKLALAFGMQVRAYTRHPREGLADDGFAFAELETVLEQSDYLALCCSLTPESAGMMDAAAFARMKQGAVVINTARGGVIDEAAAAAALRSGQLGGLLTDVLSEEPPRADNPLLSAPNTLITPHIAWAAREARAALMQTAAENLRCYLAGRPQNAVGWAGRM